MAQIKLLFLTSLCGAFIWGVINILKKRYLNPEKYDVHPDVMVVALSLGCAMSAFVLGLFLDGLPRVSMGFWLPFLVSTVINFWIQYFNVKALKLEDASIVIPLSATMPMFVILTSWFMHGEWPTLWGRAGILCIATGSYVLNLKGSGRELPQVIKKWLPERTHATVSTYCAPWLRILHSKGARLALASAYLGAIAINFDKTYVLYSSPATATSSAYFVIALAIYAWSSFKGRWGVLDKTHFKTVFKIGLLFGIGCVLMNASFQYGIVPYVGTLRRTQILWTVILATLILKEKHGISRMFGAFIIFTGCLLIYF